MSMDCRGYKDYESHGYYGFQVRRGDMQVKVYWTQVSPLCIDSTLKGTRYSCAISFTMIHDPSYHTILEKWTSAKRLKPGMGPGTVQKFYS